MTIAAPPNPWYREPWPWLLMAGPAMVIVAGVITIWLAVSSFDGLVVDDYYKRGLAINQTLARSEAARAFGIEGDWRIDPLSGVVTVELRLREGTAAPDSLRLTLAHATRAGSDQKVDLERGTSGVYTGRIAPLGPGRWQLAAEDPQAIWRIKGGVQAPQERSARLVP